MYPNINSGLGKLMAESLINNASAVGATGRFFLVFPSTLANASELKAMYSNYADGVSVTYTTLAGAVAACVAGRGDIIYLMPGHTESIATSTALNLNIAGITVVGLGLGGNRAIITLDTANSATITVSAANVAIRNVVFVANFLNVAALFTVTTAKDFQVLNCEIRDTDATHNFVAIVVVSTTSNAADGLVLDGNKIMLVIPTGATKLVSALGTNDRWTIQNNYYATPTTGTGAVLPIAAGKILTNLLFVNNRLNLVNGAATATGVIITTNGSTNSGYLANNQIQVATTTPLLITATSGFVQTNNLLTHSADKSGYVMPVIDASS